jgi:HK97 family phage prohead protease
MSIHNLIFRRTVEMRFAPECRAIASGRTLKLEGHAAVFNTRANLGQFQERIMPGAFKRALAAEQGVPFLWNHNKEKILGRTTAGTLRLKEDSKGLHYEVDLPNTEEARGYHESVRRGDVTGSSFAFNLQKGDDEWSEEQDEDRSFHALRTIRNVTNLVDCSAVTSPAYDGTDVSARNVEVPFEIRSRVAERNVGVIVTPEIAVQITINALNRHKSEEEQRARRKNLLNQILSQ